MSTPCSTISAPNVCRSECAESFGCERPMQASRCFTMRPIVCLTSRLSHPGLCEMKSGAEAFHGRSATYSARRSTVSGCSTTISLFSVRPFRWTANTGSPSRSAKSPRSMRSTSQVRSPLNNISESINRSRRPMTIVVSIDSNSRRACSAVSGSLLYPDRRRLLRIPAAIWSQ